MTYGRIFQFWMPLAMTWLMMSVEGPLLAAVIARLPDAKINLAAYGLAYSVALVVESPIINMLTAATALVRDRLSFFKLRRFNNVLNASITVLMLLAGSTSLMPWLTANVMDVPVEVGQLSRWTILLLLPWPAMVGVRRFYQGVLIAGGKTRQVALGTVLRLLAMAVCAFAAGFWSDLPGALVGGLALTAGVSVEALAARVMAGPVVAELMEKEGETQAGDVTIGALTHFYYPLAVTAILALAVHPLTSFLAGLGRLPLESLAVLPVINSLVFIFRAFGLSYQEAAIALMGSKGENEGILRRFAVMLGASTSGALALLAFTPLATVWYQDISGLSPDLAAFALLPTQIMCVMPALTVTLVWQRSVLVAIKRTGPITGSSALEIAVIVASMLCGLYLFDWTGAVAAAAAYLTGRLAGCGYLAVEQRRYRTRRPAVES
ncbi:MAG TPA: hypothetical protein VLU25_15145 [Acidobacteriota bacterium]|nr:hypothetical protein [Acidobacteriota bacterium]